ncbi:hypothetical protein VTN77DRAFT_9457 [Rasamsonia byssochlamydoides]|uniref:uncharacterized protein n=1 Tax=Rasamsonia byssochlamydoides TaxID=89139 RepID=UPI0037445236
MGEDPEEASREASLWRRVTSGEICLDRHYILKLTMQAPSCGEGNVPLQTSEQWPLIGRFSRFSRVGAVSQEIGPVPAFQSPRQQRLSADWCLPSSASAASCSEPTEPTHGEEVGSWNVGMTPANAPLTTSTADPPGASDSRTGQWPVSPGLTESTKRLAGGAEPESESGTVPACQGATCQCHSLHVLAQEPPDACLLVCLSACPLPVLAPWLGCFRLRCPAQHGRWPFRVVDTARPGLHPVSECQAVCLPVHLCALLPSLSSSPIPPSSPIAAVRTYFLSSPPFLSFTFPCFVASLDRPFHSFTASIPLLRLPFSPIPHGPFR